MVRRVYGTIAGTACSRCTVSIGVSEICEGVGIEPERVTYLMYSSSKLLLAERERATATVGAPPTLKVSRAEIHTPSNWSVVLVCETFACVG
jgi:hypothetical protein